MDIKIHLQKEDWWLYQAHIEKELPKQYKTWLNSFWVNLVIWLVVTVMLSALINTVSSFHWPTATLVTACFVLLFVLLVFNMIKIRKAYEPLDSGTFCGTHHFTFSSEGIASEGTGYKGLHSWDIVKKIERTSGIILIYLDKVYAYVFPESKLENPDEFYQCITELYSSATDHSVTQPPSTAE